MTNQDDRVDQLMTIRESDGSGLLFYRPRYYNPLLGRFISEDPFKFKVSTDFYTYTQGNPISLAGGDVLAIARIPMLNQSAEAYTIILTHASPVTLTVLHKIRPDMENAMFWPLKREPPRIVTVILFMMMVSSNVNTMKTYLGYMRECPSDKIEEIGAVYPFTQHGITVYIDEKQRIWWRAALGYSAITFASGIALMIWTLTGSAHSPTTKVRH